ncbi:alpha-amylase family glycosyl hydrolase [Gelidibacter pelagius]|uniref:T9SS type A sorting domain-containing protein n=1 Tax=Gelidibacter pelagius TaxID=2819985 RepID=A0ABS3SSM0_9FLAO|nr:alpha-amylase family glycosyl hydrolase [Gelidibacter pelagius]MBO3098717.1 T9SS type A sorting domain-containing protein [Gelidibacter pelagius]
MKNLYLKLLFLIPFFTFAQQQNVTYSVFPSPFEEDQNITLTFNGNSINEATWDVADNALYLWSWSYDLNLSNEQNSPTNGAWEASNEANKLVYDSGNDTYSITFTPSTFYNRTGIGRIGFLIKAKDGSGDKKSQDILVDVGTFQVVLSQPTAGSTTIINSGESLGITAQNTGGNATYVLKEAGNPSPLNTQSDISNYSFTQTNITQNTRFELEVSLDGKTIVKEFSVLLDPGSNIGIMPTTYQDGITYLSATEAVLVLYATGKDFVYVAGSFNDWQPDASYAMKKDPTRNNKFWIRLTGLTPGQIETYQYWVVDKTPIANSPTMVKTADPYSTLVLSPFDDPYIPASTYPNLPAYPAGQEREVTVLQTDQTPYNWQVTNFTKPDKEDLVVYEVLIRDFGSNRNFQDLIDRIDYFKNLNINAIELLPVMEFEGNESWGYNTSFHMALDKFYGTENKLKEFIDVCHQNGIAVILDVALNHAFGRNPMVRMWMDDPDGDGWGDPSTANPYFNTTPRHTYNVGSDFDHSNPRTKDYVRRVVKHWIEEFKIDGFRWDLTKGFTQNCTENDEGCTNAYQADRVAVLKEYADYSWSLDPTHYVIFEHLGSENEEKEWANYKYDEGKGVMMWGNMNHAYNELTMGFTADISGIGHKSRPTFQGPRVIGYAESHDEERLMYKNLMYGNSTNSSHDVKDLNTALSRMSALGAVTLTVPGPKMIWHFSELGMENSIFTCNDGSVNDPSGNDGDCKLDTKPQPQWTQNWTGDTNRNTIYNDWARMIELKTTEPVFKGDYTMTSNNLTPSIEIFDNALPSSALNKVIVLANFDVTAQTMNTTIPTGQTWYDLMDASGSTTYNGATVTIDAGQFRIFGNKASTLSTDSFEITSGFTIYPNPVNATFKINNEVNMLDIYDLTGKRIKSFKGDFTQTDSFDVSDLNQSIYLIKVENKNGQVLTSKLIKM